MDSFPETPDEIILSEGRRVLSIEADSIRALIDRLGPSFVTTVRAIAACKGKIIVTGVGKSGIIASKITATFNSIGVNAVFLHPTDGLHGDLGIVNAGDVVIALSKSGETSELLAIIPVVRKIGASLVAMVGSVSSTLARKADITLDCAVTAEADPVGLDLVPTASTTASLALGDALAMASLRLRPFSKADFARFHPGGSLGRRLLLTVRDLMHSGTSNPVLQPSASVAEVVEKLTVTKLGGVNIVNSEGELLGLITDGDIRRAIKAKEGFFELDAAALMTRNPITVSPDDSAETAYRKMEYRASQIMLLPVVENGKSVGIIRLHDVVGGGRE